MDKEKQMIPKKFHWVHIPERPFKLHHYLSVKSAVERSGFDEFTIWLAGDEPTGEYWERAAELVKIQKVEAPTEIFGKPITQPAHKSDVIRLMVLIEHGGAYADLDVIVTKPFTELLDNQFVMGQQGVNGGEGLCPATMLSEKDSTFAKHWLAGFKDTFVGTGPGTEGWCTHSVAYPRYLAQQMPNDVTIIGYKAFFYPLYHQKHIEMIFEQDLEFPEAYSIHLWESSGKKYLDEMTEEKIKTENTTFTRIVKELL